MVLIIHAAPLGSGGDSAEPAASADPGDTAFHRTSGFRKSVQYTDKDGFVHEEDDPIMAFIRQMDEDEAKAQATLDARTFADRDLFVGVVMSGICLNALQMGAELQFTGEETKIVWKVCENFWAAFFLVEMILKLHCIGLRAYFRGELANKMDFLIVIVGVVDNWILGVLMSEEEREKLSFLSVIKLVRLGRIFKLLNMIRELRVLLNAIFASIGAMAWLGVLLAILIYACSIMFVQFIGQSTRYEGTDWYNKEYFGDMIKAAMTSLNLAMLLEFPDIVRPILKHQPWFVPIIGVYCGAASFGIMNALIGVIVTRTGKAAEMAAADSHQQFQKKQMGFVVNISNIIYSIDTDGDGTVSPEEIEMAKDNEELLEILDKVDLPFAFTLTDLHTMLDKDGDGELTKAEFFVGMKRLIFSNDFQRQCLLLLCMAQQKRKLFEHTNNIGEDMDTLHQRLNMAGVPQVDGYRSNAQKEIDEVYRVKHLHDHEIVQPEETKQIKQEKHEEEDTTKDCQEPLWSTPEDCDDADLVVTYDVEDYVPPLTPPAGPTPSGFAKPPPAVAPEVPVFASLLNPDAGLDPDAGLRSILARMETKMESMDRKLDALFMSEPVAASGLDARPMAVPSAMLPGQVELWVDDKARQMGNFMPQIMPFPATNQQNVGNMMSPMADAQIAQISQMAVDIASVRRKLDVLGKRSLSQAPAVSLETPATGPYTLAMTGASITIQSAVKPLVMNGPIVLPPAQGVFAATDATHRSMHASFDRPMMLPGTPQNDFGGINKL